LKESYFNAGAFVSYYGFSKQTMNDKFNLAMKKDYSYDVSVFENIFRTLVSKVGI